MTVAGSVAGDRGAQRRRLDRHLFASNISAYNSAWETYGWTEGLDRVRAGRLEERVPWGAELAESADPPTLVHGGASGRGAASQDPALGPIGLPEAFLPLDGRLGFCLSGIVRPSPDGAPARRPRIATHTLLFHESLFREIDGFPQGLHLDLPATTDGAEASWFAQLRRSAAAAPGVLAEPGYAPDRQGFRRARLQEVARLARAAVAALGAQPAREALGDVYRAVGEALEPAGDARRGKVSAGGPVRVAGGRRGACLLVRLAWLSLPLADRVRVFYSILDLRGRHPTPCLVPGAAAPAPRTVSAPRTALDRRPAPASRPALADSGGPDPLGPWAALVLGAPKEYARVGARIDARGMSLYRRESEPYVVHWAPARLGAVDLLERARLESRGAGRWRGLGRLAAADLGARSPDRPAEWVEAVPRDPLLATNRRFHEGLVRGLGGRLPGAVEAGPPEARVATARLAVLAGTRARCREDDVPGGPTADSGQVLADTRARRREDARLALLVNGMRSLAEAGADAGELGAAVRGTQEHDGDEAAGLAGIAAQILGSLGRDADVPTMVAAAGLPDPIAPGLARDLVQVFLAGSNRARSSWQALLERVWTSAAASPATDSDPSDPGHAELEALQRLAWIERRRWGSTPLVSLAAKGRPGAVALARRLMEHEPGPPLSVFLALRAAVVRRPAGARGSLARGRSSRNKAGAA